MKIGIVQTVSDFCAFNISSAFSAPDRYILLCGCATEVANCMLVLRDTIVSGFECLNLGFECSLAALCELP